MDGFAISGTDWIFSFAGATMECCLVGVGTTSYTPVLMPSLTTMKCPKTHGITYRYVCVTIGKNTHAYKAMMRSVKSKGTLTSRRLIPMAPLPSIFCTLENTGNCWQVEPGREAIHYLPVSIHSML